MTRKVSTSNPIVLLCALALAGTASLPATATGASLRIVDKSFDGDTGVLSYTLLNDGSETITAWRLAVAYGDSLGIGQKLGFNHDYYMNLGKAPISQEFVDEGPLHPGQKLTGDLQLSLVDDGLGLMALSIRIDAAVFEDGGYEGDREVADTLWEARALRVAEIGKLAEVLRAVDLEKTLDASTVELLVGHAERLRSASDDPKSHEGLRSAAASVLALTRIELAEQLDGLVDAAGRNPSKVVSADSLAAVAAALEREHNLGRSQLASLAILDK